MADSLESEPLKQCQVDKNETPNSTENETKRQKLQQGAVGHTQKQVRNDHLLKLCKRLNNFFFKGFLDGNFIPFICGGSTVGLVTPWVVVQLENYPEVFSINAESMTFAEHITEPKARSKELDKVLRDLKAKETFLPLSGWRNECYEIKRIFSEPPLFKIERSASPLFGMRKYGVQITGYVNHSGKGLCLWFQKRSPTKPTWPNMMDNFVGGGITEGSVLLTLLSRRLVRKLMYQQR